MINSAELINAAIKINPGKLSPEKVREAVININSDECHQNAGKISEKLKFTNANDSLIKILLKGKLFENVSS